MPASALCWWCGAPATTHEHRFKHSTLRRVAGTAAPGKNPALNVYKGGDAYQGTLNSLKKGPQVTWPTNMCGNCNNVRSKPFDQAYDVVEEYLIRHADTLTRAKALRWDDVYGGAWQGEAAHLGRYFGKQAACMLATQRLPLPGELRDFLDGAADCPSVRFSLSKNWKAANMHRRLVRKGTPEGMSSMVGVDRAPAYADASRGFYGFDYSYYVGYVWFSISWRKNSSQSAWWQASKAPLPLFNGDVRTRLDWWWRTTLGSFPRAERAAP